MGKEDAKKDRALSKEEAKLRQEKLKDHALKHKDSVNLEGKDADAQKLMDMFTRFDANADGVIQEDEFATMLNTINPNLFTKEACQKMFVAADLNSDDKVDYKEFVAWLLGLQIEEKSCEK